MKRLSRDDAKAQAKRLQSSPMLSPQSDDGRREIVDCLMRHCESVEHAARAMTALLDNCTDPRNLTAELRSAAVSTAYEHQVIPDGCSVCYLEPDVTTGEARWYAHVSKERNGYTCAVRCGCARGQWLKRRDQERRQVEKPAKVQQSRKLTGAGDYAMRAAGDGE